MTPERWRQIDDLLDLLLDAAPHERSALLAQHCAGDAELKREVEALLAVHTDAPDFIEKPPLTQMQDALRDTRSPAPTQPDLLGHTLGHYQIQALLGAGGMGEVYRALDTRLDREVAVKVLSSKLALNPEALKRFEREAKAVAALSHPNILAIHDFGTEAGTSYAVTELLKGETLRERLSRSALPWREAVTIAAQIAEGLSAAHAQGIIHRDLKPENIFLTTSGTVKILDFGIARIKAVPSATMPTPASSSVTAPGRILGTFGYMSPEQVRGEEVDAPSDIFAFGCVLYEMLLGQRPFARATTAETMAAILRDEPRLDASNVAPMPTALRRLLQRCLAKQPTERYQTARELAADLQALLKGSRTNIVQHARSQWRLRPRVKLIGAVLLLLLGVAAAFYVFRSREQAIDSLAILPLVNASGDANAEYLGIGISEDLITHFAQLPNLRVTARSTVTRYKGKEVDPRQVGQELQVRAVLTGKVTQRADQLLIVVELVNAVDGTHLWGEQYRRPLSDLLVVQEDIAQQIAQKLRRTLSDPEKKQLQKRYTQDNEAYQLYLKGRYFWSQTTPDSLQQSTTYFQQAIAKDPLYALAYSGLADAYFLLGPSGLNVMPAREAIDKQRAAAQKALDIDDTLAEPLTSLAVVHLTHEWNWTEAERAFKRAIALKPSYAVAHSWYAACLMMQGRFNESIPEIERAQQLDPFSVGISNAVAGHYYYAQRYEQAIAQYRKTMAMNPQHFVPHADIAQVYAQLGQWNEAIAELEQAATLSERSPEVLGLLGNVYALAGRRADAQKILTELNAMKEEPAAPMDYVLVYIGLGNKDEAFAWLDKALAARDSGLLYLKVDPRFDPLRADARFQRLLQTIGLS